MGTLIKFELKTILSNYYSYTHEFETSGLEEEITLSLSEFKPVFRGTNLSIGNFDKKFISELSFMIVSQKEPDFKLQISEIIIN